MKEDLLQDLVKLSVPNKMVRAFPVQLSVVKWDVSDICVDITHVILKSLLWQQSDRTSSSSLEGDSRTTPTSSQQTSHSQPAPPFFTPEPSLRRANGIQAQLTYDSPAQGAPPTATAAGREPVSTVRCWFQTEVNRWNRWLAVSLLQELRLCLHLVKGYTQLSPQSVSNVLHQVLFG